MPTSVENYIFNELPRRVVIDPSIPTGSSFTEAWLLAATGVGTQAIPIDPNTLGFEPVVTPPGIDPEIKFWNGDKDWVEISAAAIGAIPTSEKGQPLGVATLDADGYVQFSQMNRAVVERVFVVADEAARYALTTTEVQNGDVVNQQNPSPATMWYVVDDTNLNNSSGYLPFSAGVAASVAWSGITGKPAIIGDIENIALAAEGDVIQYVAGEWVKVDISSFKASLSITISDVDSLQEELDTKQPESVVLDNLSAISTSGIVVRKGNGDFVGRELVGINGLEVAEADGNGDNPTISLTETGVTAGTYGNEYEHPVVEVDSYGRVVSVTEASSSNKEVVYILDQPTTQLLGNTRHIFGGGVVTYSSNILLELPENVPGGTWVKILCAQNFSEASGTIGISATAPTTVQGTSLFDYTAFFKLYPFTVIDLVYSSSANNWTLTTDATSFLSSLYVARQGATDGVSNSHAIISNATSPRSLNIPDRDVDLSSVGQTDFLDSTFRVSDGTDATKKIAFQASGIGTWQTKTITMPNADVDLGKVAQSASGTADGYLSNTDWTTFNNKQADLGFTPEDAVNKATTLDNPTNTTYPTTLAVADAISKGGFVAITDITPTDSGNVGTKVRPEEDDDLLTSCLSSTDRVTVQLVAVTGKTSFKPTATVNGTPAIFTRNSTSDTWTGTAAITLTGTSPYTVTAIHGDGYEYEATVVTDAPPLITTLEFSGAYPNVSTGQVQHAAAQTLDLIIAANTPFTAYEIVYESGATATDSKSAYDFAAVSTVTTQVVVANQGNSTQNLPAKARVRNVNGTWSEITASNASANVDGVNVIALNNTRPVVTAGTAAYPIIYPSTQFALKDAEEATVNANYDNVTSVLWTSTAQLVVNAADVAALGNIRVNRNTGTGSVGYNVNTFNLTATAQRDVNATTSTTNVTVWIADTPAVITKTLPAARLRSGVTAQNHTITLGSNQRLQSITMEAGTISTVAAGTFLGTWATTNNGITNTRTLSVADSDPKGTATFTGLLATNLAGRETTAVTTNLEYVLGGFVARTVTMGSFNPDGNRQVDILTNVAIASLVSVINESKAGVSMSYGNSLTDAVNSFAIVDAAGALAPTGRFMYNRDELNARSNLLGEAQFTIEESVS